MTKVAVVHPMRMLLRLLFPLALLPALLVAAQSFDVVVYGGTAGGVVAAVAAAREGATVALLEPGRHLGGMTSSGLVSASHVAYSTLRMEPV